MKILAAIDKFKGSLTSLQAAEAVKAGFVEAEVDGNLSFDIVEIADGGDGSADVLHSVKRDAAIVKQMATDPLGRQVETSFMLYSEHYSGSNPEPFQGCDSAYVISSASSLSLSSSSGEMCRCAFIEMAKISGLEMLGDEERDPLITTTYGLGELVKGAYRSGVQKITLSIGGSATNDGGTGMLQAIGFRFYDKAGKLITDYMCGGLLNGVGKIEAPEAGSEGAEILSGLIGGKCGMEVICDVSNPLLGENGATMVYGPQKGADMEKLQQLEGGMENLVKVVSEMGEKLHLGAVLSHLLPGAGAAGGVGYAVNAFLGGRMISGWRFFATVTGLEERIADADLVISGEGRIDSQSLSGKVIDGILTLAGKYGKPVWLFCGTNQLPAGNLNIFQLTDLEPDKDKCMSYAEELLERLAYKTVIERLKNYIYS